ncbi:MULTISPECIES: HAMP domain-containing sensor histidine kinase [unclassified Streptomyces]|uniref:sensor histidine kinase n=1 Tax=unclassified Streptomyces TaxID=2593676 RepID=UPI000367F861|nr:MULTISPECIES: HAMP domain-containing sensor histidine kinase [unclassified Streptomyces]MYT30991.1 HAMP domain-containing protein [Streptomyces sp. SID8354]
MGLRAKIGIAISATAAVVAVLVGVLVHQHTVNAQLDLAGGTLDSRLQTTVQDRAAGIDTGRGLINPPDLPGPLRALVDGGRRGVYLEQGGRTPYLWAATRQGSDIVALKRPYDREQQTVEALDRILWVAGAAGTTLGCVVGLLVAHRLGRRLTASAATAQRIAEGDLGARLPLSGNDEVAQLTAAVNTMAEALAGRLRAERDVTANIAHELRTPVAGLVAAAGLLPPSRPAEMVRERAERVRGLMEDVVEVARLDARTEEADREVRPLGELVRRAVAAAGHPGTGGPSMGTASGSAAAGAERAPADGEIRVRVGADGLVETDPRRVERIVVNLISNARRHGAAPVTVEADGGVIRVRDAGPGFPEELLAHGPQRFRSGGGRGGPGLGLGLTIAAGQARVLGAGLRFTNPPGGGALATVDLRAALCPGADGEEPHPGGEGEPGGEGHGPAHGVPDGPGPDTP